MTPATGSQNLNAPISNTSAIIRLGLAGPALGKRRLQDALNISVRNWNVPLAIQSIAFPTLILDAQNLRIKHVRFHREIGVPRIDLYNYRNVGMKNFI